MIAKSWNVERIRDALAYPGREFETNVVGTPWRLKRGDMNTTAQILTTLVLHNIKPKSHTSDVNYETACLLYYIVQSREVDVARIISNEIRAAAQSGHPLGARNPSILVFPGLIMGLCAEAEVPIPDVIHKTIKGTVTDNWISLHCMPRVDAPLPHPEQPEQPQQQQQPE